MNELDKIIKLLEKQPELEFLLDKALELKDKFNSLKKLKAKKIIIFNELLNLKNGDKIIIETDENNQNVDLNIYKIDSIEITNDDITIELGDWNIKFKISNDLNVEIRNIQSLFVVDYTYTYTLYSIITRKDKIIKLLSQSNEGGK